MMDTLSNAEKCTGAMVAFAIGDALGWPNETGSRHNARSKAAAQGGFVDWTRQEGGRFWNHPEEIKAGEYSDDTQLMLAVARSIISGNWQSFFSLKELPYWLQYERGGGKATKNAAKAYKNGREPWKDHFSKEYFQSGGNGAAMRVLPHVLAHAKDPDADELIGDVIAGSILTHGHPRAIIGALCYAYTLWIALNKKSTLQYGELVQSALDGANKWCALRGSCFPEGWIELANREYPFAAAWDSTARNIVAGLLRINADLSKGLLSNDSAVLEDLGAYSNFRGAGDATALCAIYLASKYANNPSLGIKTAAYSVGADTDTIAAMTGGLLGMINGAAWIPDRWKKVQDRRCLLNMAEILLSNNMWEASMRLTENSRVAEERLVASPIGKIDVLGSKTIATGRTVIVVITEARTLHGQTLYLRQYERRAPAGQALPVREERTGRHDRPVRSLTLDSNTSRQLREDPLYAKISFKKILKVTELLSSGENNIDEICRAAKVSPDIVKDLLRLMEAEERP